MVETRRLAAIMFTDLAGFTASAQADEATTLTRLREQEELVRPLLPAYGGREVKSTGDGFLVEFESALRATECAVDIQRKLRERAPRPLGPSLQLRIGIHVGDVERRGGDIFGDAVNVAARIVPNADRGGVCISEQVFDQVRNKVPYPLEKLSPRALKGVRTPIDLYRVVLPWHGVVPPLTAGSPPRLAILPFANISPDPKDEYFADGLTEELISVCSQIRGLRVIARTSVAQYRSASKPIAQIGEELGVGSVLEGSVRKIGNRLRVTVQLIDVATQEHRWSESYNRELDDVFAIQAEVARMTAGALRVELLGTDREAIERRPTSNLEAYQLYLRGIHATYAMTETTEDESFTEAIRCLEGAIRIDPTFTLAYSYLADLVVGGAQAGELTHPSQGNERARQLVDRALELDPNSSAAHSARGNIARFAEFDWGLAESEYRKAISLNPSNSRAHLRLGLLLANLARFDEADDELRLTVELDPFEWPAAGWWSMILFRHGATEAAIALAKSTRDLIPSYHWPHVILAWYYSGAGRWEDARKEAELSKGPLIRWMRFLRAIVFTFLEEKDEAKLLLQEFEAASKKEYVPPSWLAGLNAMLGNTGRALELLEGGQEAGDPELDYQWEYFDPIRDDPRFTAMLRRLKLPTEVTWQRVTPRTGP